LNIIFWHKSCPKELCEFTPKDRSQNYSYYNLKHYLSYANFNVNFFKEFNAKRNSQNEMHKYNEQWKSEAMKIYKFIILANLIIVNSLILVYSGYCAGNDGEAIITLDELIKEALDNNPEIQAVKMKYEAAKARPIQESTLPDPVVGFMSENMGNPIPFTTIGEEAGSKAGFSFTQEIPYPGKLKLKGEIADKEAQIEETNYIATKLNVIAQLKIAYYDYYFLTKAIEIVNKDKELLEKLEKIAEAKYAVGKGIQQDVLKAQVEISVLLNRLIVLEQQKNSVVALINKLLNRKPDTPLGKPVDFQKPALNYSLEELYKIAWDKNPMLKAKNIMIEKSSAELNLARKEYYPDFMVGISYGYSGKFADMWKLEAGLRIPLYYWRKQRYGIIEKNKLLNSSHKDYQNAKQTINFMIKDQYLLAKASEELIKLYSEGIIPQATLALESSISSYEV